MSRIVQFMRDLVAKGMAWEDAAVFAERFEESLEQALASAVKPRSAGAIRQANYRERQRNGDVTPVTQQRDVTPLSEGSQGSLSPEPPNLPNPPNLSLEPPISPTKSTRKPVRGAFARFWAEYPLKVGKGKAEPAYDRAWRRCETDDPEAEILDGLKRCKPLWEPEFIPHPTTWLNRLGWLDQLQPEDTGNSATGPPRFDLVAFERERAERQRLLEEDAA